MVALNHHKSSRPGGTGTGRQRFDQEQHYKNWLLLLLLCYYLILHPTTTTMQQQQSPQKPKLIIGIPRALCMYVVTKLSMVDATINIISQVANIQ